MCVCVCESVNVCSLSIYTDVKINQFFQLLLLFFEMELQHWPDFRFDVLQINSLAGIRTDIDVPLDFNAIIIIFSRINAQLPML